MGEELITARYFNSNSLATAIVAVVNWANDEIFDWAAYLGASRYIEHERDCVRDVAQHGCKLSVNDACHFFPDLPIEKYRL